MSTRLSLRRFVLLILALAACTSGLLALRGPNADASGVQVLNLSATKGTLMFNTTRLHAHPGTVRLVMHNPAGGGIKHGIAIEGHGVDKDGPIVAPGQSSSVTVTLKKGTYTFYCPVPGHEAAGMKGTLTVS